MGRQALCNQELRSSHGGVCDEPEAIVIARRLSDKRLTPLNVTDLMRLDCNRLCDRLAHFEALMQNKIVHAYQPRGLKDALPYSHLWC